MQGGAGRGGGANLLLLDPRQNRLLAAPRVGLRTELAGHVPPELRDSLGLPPLLLREGGVDLARVGLHAVQPQRLRAEGGLRLQSGGQLRPAQ